MYKNQINEILDLVASLRRCSDGDHCEEEGCEGEHCYEHENRLMKKAADVLEVYAETLSELNPSGQSRMESDGIGWNRTYTMLEIIRLVQHVTSDTIGSLGVDDYSGMLAVYEVERGIVAELTGCENDRN